MIHSGLADKEGLTGKDGPAMQRAWDEFRGKLEQDLEYYLEHCAHHGRDEGDGSCYDLIVPALFSLVGFVLGALLM